jgi:hypothetical protein
VVWQGWCLICALSTAMVMQEIGESEESVWKHRQYLCVDWSARLGSLVGVPCRSEDCC